MGWIFLIIGAVLIARSAFNNGFEWCKREQNNDNTFEDRVVKIIEEHK